MALSKSTRIMILLGIDTAFFLLELIVGYAVHSLALVADAFHMLNDVLSLCVGLWAVKVAHQKPSSKMYTYGWQRAETLGALVNGVFLVALCMTIFLESIQRFVEPQVVAQPKLILIVGFFGLLSNILGLLLFHEHGHSHGGDSHGHSHGESNTLATAEEGRKTSSRTLKDNSTVTVADESGNIADVLPQTTVAGLSKISSDESRQRSKSHQKPDDIDATVESSSPVPFRKSSQGHNSFRRHSHKGSRSRSRFSSVDDMHIHPASFRNEIIAASRLEDIESRTGSDAGVEEGGSESDHLVDEESPLLARTPKPRTLEHALRNGSAQQSQDDNRHDSWHRNHKHETSKDASSGGHSHSDLNMKGVFLHVMGDALGNIGVIASALIIWLISWPGRYYADPAISLIITFIILGSAIPLCKAASRILLQAVPAGISVDDIKEDIAALPGIVSCHHLHVWQLSDVKLVASLHIELEFDFKGEGSARYMQLARAVRRCLHEYGIHSSTIQPEFCLDGSRRQRSWDPSDDEDAGPTKPSKQASRVASKAPSLRSQPEACLLDCGDECDEGGQCCPATVIDAEAQGVGHNH